MVKPEELRKYSDEELLKMKKDLEYGLMKASSVWGREKVTNKESGANVKGHAKKGLKTSLQKEIRKNIARINTIINEKKINNEA